MQVPLGDFDPVDNVRAFHLGWHFSSKFGEDHSWAIPVECEVMSAPMLELSSGLIVS